MNRMTVAALAMALAGCANFDQLEDDALDAGRVAGMSGGSAGGMSGGAAGGSSGGSAGGSGGGSAGGTGGGSAGGTGGGSAGGNGGGSAGGSGGGSAGGSGGGSAGGSGGGSAGGMSGGSAGGASGGSAGGTTGFSPPPLFAGMIVRQTQGRYLGVAASAPNNQLAVVEASDGGVLVHTNNGRLNYPVPGSLADLDARFGMVVVTTTESVRWLDLRGSWWEVNGVPIIPSVGLSTPIFRSASAATAQLASYWRVQGAATLYSNVGLPSDGGPPPDVSVSTAILPNPATFRVRPDQNGQSGVIAGSFSLDGGCSTTEQAVFGRITSGSATVTGGTVQACDMMVASSENQTALLVWRAADLQGRIRTAFWQPLGLDALPPDPTVWLSSTSGFSPAEAIATDGVRHAAIVYQPAGSVVTVPDAGVQTSAAGYLLVILGEAPRFVGLGPNAVPPFGLAFGNFQGGAVLYVMANCSTGSATGLCTSPGAAVGITQP